MSVTGRLRFTRTQLVAWKAAALAAGQSLEDWLVSAADAYAASAERERRLTAAGTKKERIIAFAKLGGKQPAEIAALVGTTRNNVNSTISSARKEGKLPALSPAEREENRRRVAILRNEKRHSKC